MCLLSLFGTQLCFFFLSLESELVLEMAFRNPLCIILSTFIMYLCLISPLVDLPFLSCHAEATNSCMF